MAMLPKPGSPEFQAWLVQQNRKDRLARTVPDAPTGLSAVNDGGNVSVTWPIVPGFVVTLYRGVTDVFADATELRSFISSTSYTDANVLGSTSYWYWITSTNAAGASDESTPATVTTP